MIEAGTGNVTFAAKTAVHVVTVSVDTRSLFTLIDV